jgi:small nuclear ribonucleoprotein (snRNP)-like protein
MSLTNIESFVINPKPFINSLLRKPIICKTTCGYEYKGYLVSVDGCLNIQLAMTEEYVGATSKWINLGDVLIRGSSILYIRGVEEQSWEGESTE